jgi:hypothetical protein
MYANWKMLPAKIVPGIQEGGINERE